MDSAFPLLNKRMKKNKSKTPPLAGCRQSNIMTPYKRETLDKWKHVLMPVISQPLEKL